MFYSNIISHRSTRNLTSGYFTKVMFALLELNISEGLPTYGHEQHTHVHTVTNQSTG